MLGPPCDFAGGTRHFAVIGFNALELYGSPTTFWLFRLFPPFEKWNGSSVSNPMGLQLQTDLPLQVLDLLHIGLVAFNAPIRPHAQRKFHKVKV